MSEDVEMKPLKWVADPDIGYSVRRRPDGGMHYTFTDVSPATLQHWRDFALQHLLDSDRLTRNLYDLRQIDQIPEEAIEYAVEANTDPSARNIRVAVMVSNEPVRRAIQKIADLTAPGGVEIGIFEDIEKAETWLDRPLSLMV
jgi:hypothetical protein